MYKPATFKPVHAFNNPSLRQLYAQSTDQERLKHRVCSHLPPALAKQVMHCAIKNNKLLVFTHSPLWASQLRFYQAALGNALAGLHRVDSVQIKIIATRYGASARTPSKASIPSIKTLEIMQKQCLFMADSPLKKAMLKLSTTLKKLAVDT